LQRIDGLELRVNQFKPMRGGSSFIDAPDATKKKQAIVNVRNLDNKCFMWAVLSALHPVERHIGLPELLSAYKQYEHELSEVLNGLSFPLKLKTSKVSSGGHFNVCG